MMTRLPIRFAAMSEPLDHLFEGFFGTSAVEEGFEHPTVNVWETDEAYHVEAELPGFEREEIELTIHDDELVLKAEHLGSDEKKGEDEGVQWLRRERVKRSYRRSLRLPAGVDATKVDANLANGVLKIELAKAEERKPRRIDVKS